MGKMKNCYDVYDMKLKKVIIHGAEAGELSRKFGNRPGYFSYAANEGILVKGRYRIYIVDIFALEWNDITRKLKRFPEIIRNIKIVAREVE